MLVIDTQQRDALAGTGPRQARLEIGDPQIGAEGIELPHEPIGERTENPRLVVDPGRDRPDDVEAAACVLEQQARDLPHLDVPSSRRMAEL